MAKIKINKELLQRATALSEELGYSSVDELVEHLLEKALREKERGQSDKEKVEQRLRGLGYID